MLGKGDWPRSSREEDVDPPVNLLQTAEESKDSIESILDTFVGGTLGDSYMGNTLFFIRSPYSPFLLDRYLGWRPLPRDALDKQQGQHEDQYCGGWTDAFQDLLCVSSGLPLLDPSELQFRNRFSRELFTRDGGAPKDEIGFQAEVWIRHMKQHRLDEVLFPYRDRSIPYRSPRTMPEWVTLREVERSASEELRRLAGAFRQGEGVWRKEIAPNIERIRAAAMDEPETEEDAYRAVNRQADAERRNIEAISVKWDNLFGVLKRIGDDEDKPREARVISSLENTKPTWSGGTKTVTKKEWVDGTGAVHTETVVSVKNAAGEETSRRVSHSIRSDDVAQEDHPNRGVHGPNADGPGDRKDVVPVKDDKKPSGWFWTRR
ncbi:hypothetical protein B0T14DRAFT_169261 [Immersiella caudata]|uniref:Uncharacterized protein n=1 Tax=Immersiella caudata TaxID=314043 RepID=A0AA39WX69_9PEZI|nr:hypothetical protein B0T14DRAFT_169261 [Immersiella caudata]